ncbi:hypothetical protein AB0K60_17540 [Thermopolyspora sp. NPDC052614]|uniref:hypothetical protein n=1 Tax=Thermopolyspora sp. NPDC052614 TaxID=3155682 RepID=UPI003425DBD9
MRIITAGALAAACGLALTGSIPTASALVKPPSAAHAQPSAAADRTWEDALRSAMRRFHDPKVAERYGYTRTDSCKQFPFEGPRGEHLGAMGYHYVNKRLAADSKIDPYRPEILVYVPGKDGGRRLGAVEYLKYDDDSRLSTTHDRPRVFGKSFDGPFPPLEDGMPVHYSLHVWIFKPNPHGIFEPWNPNVRCPGGAVRPGKVKPAADKPAADKPAADKPAADKPRSRKVRARDRL